MTSTPSPTASEQAASRAARPREAGRWTNAQARSVVGAATVVRGPSRSAELRAFAARLLSAHGLREPAGSDGHRPGERSPTPRGTVALRWNTPIRLSVGSDSQCGRDSQRGSRSWHVGVYIGPLVTSCLGVPSPWRSAAAAIVSSAGSLCALAMLASSIANCAWTAGRR
jgi:hypothetical protein